MNIYWSGFEDFLTIIFISSWMVANDCFHKFGIFIKSPATMCCSYNRVVILISGIIFGLFKVTLPKIVPPQRKLPILSLAIHGQEWGVTSWPPTILSWSVNLCLLFEPSTTAAGQIKSSGMVKLKYRLKYKTEFLYDQIKNRN